MPGSMPALLFDMFGTLVEPPTFRTRPEVVSSHLAREWGLEVRPFQVWWEKNREVRLRQPFAEILSAVSRYAEGVGQHRTSRQLEQGVRRAMDAAQDQPVRFVDGMAEVLDTLRERGYGIAVLENLDEVEERGLEGLSWPKSVDQFVLSNSTDLLLPEPGIFEFALRTLWDARADRSALVSSGWNGALEGARRAGIRDVVFVRGTRERLGLLTPEEDATASRAADATLESIEALLDRFR